MKRLFLLTVIIVGSLCLSAGNYDYMAFVTDSGIERITSANLVMTIQGNNLVANNGTNSLTIALTNLQKMYFCDENGIYNDLNIVSDTDMAPVAVYSTDGKHIGSFSTMTDAVLTLSKGTYIVTRNNQSTKILVP